jgi:glyoxylase-like metal-dependent hydrolase (beta-lactamase superfamily II)
MRRLLIVLVLVLATALTVGFAKRRTLAPRLVALLVERPEPKAPPPLDPGVAWNGEWYTVQHLDEATIAIGEPRSEGRNVSYLLLGKARAVLFDAGEGWADLSPVVDDLTDLPVIVIPSHLHYDHIGSIEKFSAIALPDLPELRAQAPDGVLVPTFNQFLGAVVDRDPPTLHVTEWWKPGEPVDLGGREVVVRHTPGHTPESISLWDPARRWLFSGDYITPQPLFAFLPGSSIGAYRSTARTLMRELPDEVVFWGAHDEPTDTLAPQLGITDLRDLARVLEAIERGEAEASGFFPRVYPVNERLEIWADIGDR